MTSCSSMNLSNMLSSVQVMGYTLQSMASGVPLLNLIAWSQGREGGNLCASSSLNTEAYLLYTSGSSTFEGSDLACMASSVAMLWLVHSSSNWATIACCSCQSSCCCTGRILWHVMGRYCGWRVPSFHLKRSKAASHG